MANITSIDGKAREPNQTLIQHIEDLLKLAQNGEMRSLFYVCGWDNGDVDEGMCPDPRDDPEKLIGALATVQTSMAVQNALLREGSGLMRLLEQYFIPQ